jgi:hypothetical protein
MILFRRRDTVVGVNGAIVTGLTSAGRAHAFGPIRPAD